MRRPLTWLGLAVGALAFWRWSLRRRKPEPEPEQPAAGDPAEELKRKLAESRTEDADAVAPEPAEEEKPSLEERRRAVHDRARQAIDDMLGGEDLPGEESH